MKLVKHSSKVVELSTKKKDEKKEIINQLVNEYSALSEQSKTLESRKSYLSKKIKEYAVKHGTKDDKGSYIIQNDEYVFGQVASISIVMKDNIIDNLKKMGFDDCVHKVEVVDKDLIDKYYNEGAITDDNLKELFETKENTPRVMVKKLEEMPEVKVYNAASTKKRRK